MRKKVFQAETKKLGEKTTEAKIGGPLKDPLARSEIKGIWGKVSCSCS
jgi:hypothetical protein